MIKKLKILSIENFDINNVPGSLIVNNNHFSFGLSKWVSPKRTRSYPYARIYDTLDNSKKITIILIIKDEGKNGDRDFIQWDTVSLMSLLDIFVIFTYYKDAEKHPKLENKITNQKFNNQQIKNKIDEIRTYHSSSLHWNLKEINQSFPTLIKEAKKIFQELSKKFKVEFHSEKGIDNFLKRFNSCTQSFIDFSRTKAKAAQNREMQTIQPKELLSSSTKASITITNYLGGEYYFTVDEISIKNNKCFLIEAKHSKHSLLPNITDIKDGLLKIILYTNLKDVMIKNIAYKPIPIIKLTSPQLKGVIKSTDSIKKRDNFIKNNPFSKKQIEIITKLFLEANTNNFIINIGKDI